MKKLFLSAVIAFLASATMVAQSDTVVINNPSKVILETNDDTLNIKIHGKEYNPNYRYSKSVIVNSEKEEVTRTSSHGLLGWDFSRIENDASTSEIEISLGTSMGFGWNTLLGKPDGMKMKWSSTVEASIGIAQLRFTPARSSWWFTFDWGFNFTQYRLKHCMIASTGDMKAEVAPFADNASGGKSMFYAMSGEFTLMAHRYIGKHNHVGLGLVCNEMSDKYCMYKTSYTLDDGTKVKMMDDINTRSYLFGIKAEWMFFDNMELYAKYTATPLFKKDCGPSFRQLSVGLQLRF